jgi:hypothetical protein
VKEGKWGKYGEGKDVKQAVNTKNCPLFTTYYPLKGENGK